MANPFQQLLYQVPGVGPALAFIQGSAGLGGPQGQNEPNAVYGLRQTAAAPGTMAAGAAGMFADDLRKGVTAATMTPAIQAQQNAMAPKATVKLNAPINSVEGLTEGLIRRGIPGHVARGVAAGLIAESGGDPFAINPVSGAFGYSQWLGPRQQNLFQQYGNKPSAEKQLDFLASELKGGDHGGPSVMQARTPEEALQRFVTDFARPAKGKETLGDLARGYAALGLKVPFDDSYLRQSQQILAAGAQAAMTPTHTEIQGPALPELPTPTPAPKTDFAAADAALQQLKPAEMTLKAEKDIQWKNFWGGLGKAMMSSPEGEGLGSFFLRLGGGALAGKAAASDEIQQRKDEFSTKLAKWQAAVYEHDFQKAQIHQQELVADWQAGETYALNKFKLAYEQAQPKIDMVGNSLVVRQTDPQGKISIDTTPIAPLVQWDAAKAQASLTSQAFGTYNQALGDTVGLENRFGVQMATLQAAQDMTSSSISPKERAAAAAAGIWTQASNAISLGRLDSILPDDELKVIDEKIRTDLTRGGKMMPGSKEYTEAYKTQMTGYLGEYMTKDPGIMNKVIEQSGTASTLFDSYQRQEDTKYRRTVNARGQVSESTTGPGMPF